MAARATLLQMHKTKVVQFNQHLEWAPKLEPGHLVQFYPQEDALLYSLEKFVSTGMKEGDTCIIITGQKHREKLDERLRRNLNVPIARMRGRYITFDAEQLINHCTEGDKLNKDCFFDAVGNIVAKASKRSKPVRIFDEIVALLWQQGKSEAVISLEEYWNEIMDNYACCLYCAYPMRQFDRSVHGELFEQIALEHNRVTPSFASIARDSFNESYYTPDKSKPEQRHSPLQDSRSPAKNRA